MLRFTIPGAPRTKKNHGWRTKQGAQMPSHAYTEWSRGAQLHLCQRKNLHPTGDVDLALPLAEQLNCRAIFYRDALRGDAVGYYQALADTLEGAKIVYDDKQIVSWDGSRLLKDAKNPRIEVVLEAAR